MFEFRSFAEIGIICWCAPHAFCRLADLQTLAATLPLYGNGADECEEAFQLLASKRDDSESILGNFVCLSQFAQFRVVVERGIKDRRAGEGPKHRLMLLSSLVTRHRDITAPWSNEDAKRVLFLMQRLANEVHGQHDNVAKGVGRIAASMKEFGESCAADVARSLQQAIQTLSNMESQQVVGSAQDRLKFVGELCDRVGSLDLAVVQTASDEALKQSAVEYMKSVKMCREAKTILGGIVKVVELFGEGDFGSESSMLQVVEVYAAIDAGMAAIGLGKDVGVALASFKERFSPRAFAEPLAIAEMDRIAAILRRGVEGAIAEDQAAVAIEFRGELLAKLLWVRKLAPWTEDPAGLEAKVDCTELTVKFARKFPHRLPPVLVDSNVSWAVERAALAEQWGLPETYHATRTLREQAPACELVFVCL